MATSVVPLGFADNPAGTGQQGGDRRCLTVAELDEQSSPVPKAPGKLSGKPTVDFEAIGAAVECEPRVVVAHLGLEGRNLGGRNVWGIADDQVEGGFRGQGSGAVSQDEIEPIADGVPRGVGASDGEGGGRNVESRDAGFGHLSRNRYRQATRARTPVQHPDGPADFERALPGPGPGVLGQQLGFRSGDQNVGGDGDFKTAESGGPQQVLKRLAPAAAADEAAHCFEGRVVEVLFEPEVELEPRDPEDVGKDQFDLQARGLHPAGFEVSSAALDDFEQTHGGQVALAALQPQI